MHVLQELHPHGWTYRQAVPALSPPSLFSDVPEVLAKHADWVEEFLPKYGFTFGSGLEGEVTPEKLHDIVQTEIGLVFKEVLKDAGVYKCTEEGRTAFMRFVDRVNA